MIGEDIIYIGKTGSPFVREQTHFTNMNKMGVFEYRFIIFGPFPDDIATVIESTEIYKNRLNEKLINKQSKKHERGKKISIKDFPKMGLFIFRKRGKEKKVVSKFIN